MEIAYTYVRYNREGIQSNFIARTYLIDGLFLAKAIRLAIHNGKKHFTPEVGTISQFWADTMYINENAEGDVGDRAYVEMTDDGIKCAFNINDNILSVHEYLTIYKQNDETTEKWYDENTTPMSQEQVKEFMNTDFIIADYSR